MQTPDYYEERLDWIKDETINELVHEFQDRVCASRDIFSVADLVQYVREGEPRAESWRGSNNVFSAAAEFFYNEYFEVCPYYTNLPLVDGEKPRFQRNDKVAHWYDDFRIGLPFWPHDFRISRSELSHRKVDDLHTEESMMLTYLVDKFVDEMVATKAKFCVNDMDAYVRKLSPPLRWTSFEEFLSPEQLDYFEELCIFAEFLDCVSPLDDPDYDGPAVFQANGKPSTLLPFPA